MTRAIVQPVEGSVDVGGLRLHYLDWQSQHPEQGLPLILLHGINVQAHTWDPIAAALSSDRRVIAVDLRGHGDSDWAPEGYAVTSFAQDLVACAAALGISRAVWLGHSLGARIAIAVAGAHPELVGRLILSDTGPEVPRSAAEFSRDIVASTGTVRGFRTEDEALAHYQRLHPEWQPEFHDLHVAHQLRRNWVGKLVFKADPELFWVTGSAGAREAPYLWEMAARIACPSLMIWGSRSSFFDAELLARMRDAIAQMSFVEIDSGHYVPRERPAEFIAAIRTFLTAPTEEDDS